MTGLELRLLRCKYTKKFRRLQKSLNKNPVDVELVEEEVSVYFAETP